MKSKHPNIFYLKSLVEHINSVHCKINNKWIPARPLGYPSWIHRFKCAYLVFSGKADVLIWPEGQ